MDWMKYRYVYFLISALIVGAGIFGLLKWGVRLGIDFTGGTVVEYKVDRKLDFGQVTRRIEDVGIKLASIQETSNETILLRLAPLTPEQKGEIHVVINEIGGNASELKYETVGPTIGPELTRKTLYALLLASTAIFTWIAFQFRSYKFGVSAVLATIHDALLVVGGFAILGHYFAAEIDFLFVTAILTVLSFSVHDTIVVYDRIRETQKKTGGEIYDLANKAISETMVRSLNNSFTLIFMLAALILLGGETTRWFSVALLIGTIAGTYSSPFVAVPILVTWDKLEKRFRKNI